MSLENFILGKILGKGSYGSVRIVERKEDHKIYAMKSVIINILSEKEKVNSFNEVRLLASLKHKNIIDYKESFFDENSKTLNIVMEYADDGDLKTKISETVKNNLYFEESTIWNVLIQTLEGLKYLHKNNIIHRDLKSANLFLTKNGFIKIGDLNVSTIAKKGVANTQTGTPYYASPEIWNDKPYNSKCDIWSLGCIIYEMATLHVPFRGTSLHQLYCRIMKGVYPKISSRYSNELKHIIKIILNIDAQKRPSAEELLKYDIIQKKIKELGINKNDTNKSYEKAMLIKTIKIPKNISQINKQLPQQRYELKQKKNKDEMFNNDEYEYSKSYFYNLANKEQPKLTNEKMNMLNDALYKINLVNQNVNNEGKKYNNININDIIITTNDTDRINIHTKEGNEIDINDDLKKYLINQNILNNNLILQNKVKKAYKDTKYNFFLGNKDNNKNINNNINQFLINNKNNEPKQRRNVVTSSKKLTDKEKKLPNIRPISVNKDKNELKYNKLSKNNLINARENKINIKSVKIHDINKKNNRKKSCVSAVNKRKINNINNIINEKESNNKKIKPKKNNKNKHIEHININIKNKENKDKLNINQFQIYHKSNSKQKQRPISTGNYHKKNFLNEKLGNISNENKDKNKINAKVHYNQYYKKEDENLNNKNKISPNKHKVIYERIEIVKNGEKNQYNRGKGYVQYIEMGNHYNQYRNFKNNYQVVEYGKGLNIIVPNKMMN